MTFLPIVARELRVAARRPTTFRIRFACAAVAAALGGFLLLATLLPGWGLSSGRGLFRLLSALGLVLAILAGPLFTADCLSRERRQGTLGLLFLTDLGGFDVVAGKLAALGLVPLHGLLATLPILGLTLFMGGITGPELVRVSLVLLATLWFSLAVGLLVSSCVSDDRQAVGLTLGITLAAAALSPLLGFAAQALPGLGFLRPATALGPVGLYQFSFDPAYRVAPGPFAGSLLGQVLTGGLLVVLATVVIRHGVRSGSGNESANPRSAVRRASSTARSRRIFADNPIAWLAWHDSWVRRGARWATGLSLGLAVLVFLLLAWGGQPARAGHPSLLVLHVGFYLLKVLVAIHVVYFLQDACRNGLMEMLLVTPVSSQRLRDGHQAAIRRLFVWPWILLASASLALGVAGTWVTGGDWPDPLTLILAGLMPSLWNVVVHAADLLAVGAYASVCALRSDRPSRALLRTTVVVLLLPLVLCSSARIVADLYFLAQAAPALERFRDLARGWYFPGVLGRVFGAPRSGA